MKRVAYVQHLEEEGPGAVAAWAAARGVELVGFRADEGKLPPAGAVEGTIVLGGPFGATDAEPAWLDAERAFIAGAIARAHPLIGICLGGQMIAAALGAVVRRGAAEAGWVDVTLLDEGGDGGGTLRALTWHEDTFSLPGGATRLGRSAGCPEQGFRRGESIVTVQFHPEWTPAIVAALGARFGAEMPSAVHAAGDYEAIHRFLFATLDRWRAAATGR